MTSALLYLLAIALLLLLAVAFHRRSDLRRQQNAIAERTAMAQRTNEQAPLQIPVIDLSRCLGCGTCVQACPEVGVLELVHGQAAVVNPALCVGHGRCVAECPVGAVLLSQGDLSSRRDVPVLDAELQAVGSDGTFLAGEITAKALIRSATRQGTAVAASIARRTRRGAHSAHRATGVRATGVQGTGVHGTGVHDLVIVGAGPAGLACALASTEHRLDFVLIDQETAIGGTVAKYPRRKLVLTEPIELPLHGRLPQREYAKEELMELWQGIADHHALPFRGGVRFERAERQADGTFHVHTDGEMLRAHHVVLAVGRRGTPRRLGIPGEDLPHVAYSLIDASTYAGCDAVIVGGGDSAVEAALALAEQGDNTVTIVYRQDEFFRIRRKNHDRLTARIASGHIRVLYRSQLTAIHHDRVAVEVRSGEPAAPPQLRELPAAAVFLLVGGVAPFGQLAASGVSFDPAQRARAEPAIGGATGATGQQASTNLLPVLTTVTVLTLGTLVFTLWHRAYYALPMAERAADPMHAWLRPDHSLGLGFGIAAVVAILANLAYLLRRQQRLGVRFGTLTGWMSVHITTGFAALLLAALHAAMAPRQTPGGHAFAALAALIVTGAIGRWFYAWLPRAANGRELELAKLRSELQQLTSAGDRGLGGDFGKVAHEEIQALLDRRQWRSTFVGRVIALLGLQWDLWSTLRRLQKKGQAAGINSAELAAVLTGARAAHRTALAVAHLEDLRAVLGTWRWLHRWLAFLMILLIGVHVVMAWLHGAFSGGGA